MATAFVPITVLVSKRFLFLWHFLENENPTLAKIVPYKI